MGDFPETIPVFPLTGALLLPGGHMPLNIFEPRYLEMVNDAMQSDKLIGMIQPCLKTASKSINPPHLSGVGCIGRITACQETGDGRLLISLSGVARYNLLEESQSSKPYRRVKYKVFDIDMRHEADASAVDRKAVLDAFRAFLSANGMEADWSTVNKTDTDTLITALSMMSPFEPAEKQALLEAPDLKTRAEILVAVSEFYLARNSDEDVPSVQ
ncbi:MAG: LON peptidase substrate-binding domain-containing protein [Pseudomonadota bacterium]